MRANCLLHRNRAPKNKIKRGNTKGGGREMVKIHCVILASCCLKVVEALVVLLVMMMKMVSIMGMMMMEV